MIFPDARQEEEHWHVPDIHADDEPYSYPMPAGHVLGIYFHIVGKPGSVNQNCVVEKDAPGENNSDQINVRSPGGFSHRHHTVFLLLVFLHPQFHWLTLVVCTLHLCNIKVPQLYQ